MGEFERQLWPVLFMYAVVIGLAPLIGFSIWSVLQGDRMREAEAAARVAAASTSNSGEEASRAA